MKYPNVSILIVNYNGRSLLEGCLSSLQEISYPKEKYEVIVVDNHSMDDSVSYIRRTFPWVKVIESEQNLGFTGGNNPAFEHAMGDLIVLLNNDTEVDANWLKALVVTAERNPKVGLFSSRLRFATPYIKLKIRTKAIQRSDVEESIDFSPIGVMIENITCKQKKLDELIWYGKGFYDSIPGAVTARWTKEEAEIFLPFPYKAWKEKTSAQYTLTLHGYPTDQPLTAPFELSWENQRPFYKGELKPQSVKQVSLTVEYKDIAKDPTWFIQNAGNVLLHDGYSKDRGSLIRYEESGRKEFYELESTYYLQPKIITAVCGASCLIRRDVINEIKFLDGNYFMYYEDVEFSVRAWKSGWDIMYVPDSLVYHYHKATTRLTSKVFFIHLAERNHLFFTFTHYPFMTFLKQFMLFHLRLSLSTAKCFVSFLKEDMERYERWRTQSTARTLAMRDFIKMLPKLIRNRWHWGHKSKRSFSQLERMMY